ncbi:MAG: haloalkane dehalogenase [Acidobacteriota bacterium]
MGTIPNPQAGEQISADFPYASRYLEVLGSKMHYVEEGQGDPILFVHGNPTSSYIWRNIIPYAARQGRAIALDLIGMGKSDKPDLDYRFEDHVRYFDAFVDALGLKRPVLVLHDWGSALGFHYSRRHPQNVRALAFFEAILAPVPGWQEFPEGLRNLFQAFRHPQQGQELILEQNAFIEKVLPSGVVRTLSEKEMAAYRAPYPRPSDRKPLWRWPNEIPIAMQPPEVATAVQEYNAWLQQSDLPKLLFHAAPGAILPEAMLNWCRQSLSNLSTVDLGRGYHYLQEDHPHRIGRELEAWLTDLGVSRQAAKNAK